MDNLHFLLTPLNYICRTFGYLACYLPTSVCVMLFTWKAVVLVFGLKDGKQCWMSPHVNTISYHYERPRPQESDVWMKLCWVIPITKTVMFPIYSMVKYKNLLVQIWLWIITKAWLYF